MKVVTASAFALAMLIGIGSASSCEFMDMAYTAPQPVQPVASATVKQMAVAYLKELANEHRIA